MRSRRVGSLVMHGGVGAGSGWMLSVVTGAKALGLLGKVSVGSSALPFFLVAGTVSGLAFMGVRMATKKRRW